MSIASEKYTASSLSENTRKLVEEIIDESK